MPQSAGIMVARVLGMMRARTPVASMSPVAIHVRVVGPDSALPSAMDLRRLFPPATLTQARRERLQRCAKVVAVAGAQVVGLASFESWNDDIRLHELACDPTVSCSAADIVRQLLDALELACLASGSRRIVLLPQAVVSATPFERLGYRVVHEGCAGAWLEKIKSVFGWALILAGEYFLIEAGKGLI